MAAPTKKQFDLIVVTWVLLEIAWGGLVHPWAARKSADQNANDITKDVAAATLLVS